MIQYNYLKLFISDAKKCSIEINEIDNRYEIITDSKSSAAWHVAFTGYPRPNLAWYDNNFNEISKMVKPGKYVIGTSDNITILNINQLELTDTGEYTLKASNQIESVSKKFQLLVRGRFSSQVMALAIRNFHVPSRICCLY